MASHTSMAWTPLRALRPRFISCGRPGAQGPVSPSPLACRPFSTYLCPTDRSKSALTFTPRSPFSAPARRILPFFSSSLRHATTLAPSPAANITSATRPTTIPKSLPNWLLGCSALVLGILSIGGLTRLTESGLSITEWNPITGILPPITQAEWDVEWDKYKVSPEGVLLNSKIDMREFKNIFYMEWAHRIAGRALGVLFIVPTVYYLSRYRLPRPLSAKLLLIGLGIGCQGALGWYMVKSGLEQKIIDTKGVPRVSQYRLAAHLSAALALYVGMLHTALGLKRDIRVAEGWTSTNGRSAVTKLGEIANSPAVRRYRGLVRTVGAMVFLTAVSGAFVAGLDAGLVYNEFPTMGGRLVPPTDELMDKRYAQRTDGGDSWWRNMLENPVTAQFDHRLFATTTFTVLASLPFIARFRSLRIGPHALPRITKRLADLTAGAAVAQVTLGITTLLYLVPVPLAAMHQAGSVILLTCLTGLAVSLRRPARALEMIKRGLAVERKSA